MKITYMLLGGYAQNDYRSLHGIEIESVISPWFECIAKKIMTKSLKTYSQTSTSIST